jgi:hypothetical protein
MYHLLLKCPRKCCIHFQPLELLMYLDLPNAYTFRLVPTCFTVPPPWSVITVPGRGNQIMETVFFPENQHVNNPPLIEVCLLWYLFILTTSDLIVEWQVLINPSVHHGVWASCVTIEWRRSFPVSDNEKTFAGNQVSIGNRLDYRTFEPATFKVN